MMDINFVFTWVLFLGLFPIGFFWLRRAWKILKKKDYSYVALKKGEPPKNPQKYAPYSAFVNLLAGSIYLVVIILIVGFGLQYNTWTAIVGITLWGKLFVDFIISRHAHMK